MSKLADRLKKTVLKILRQSDLDQRDLAKRLHITPQSVGRYFRPNTELRTDTIEAIAEALNCDPGDFFSPSFASDGNAISSTEPKADEGNKANRQKSRSKAEPKERGIILSPDRQESVEVGPTILQSLEQQFSGLVVGSHALASDIAREVLTEIRSEIATLTRPSQSTEFEQRLRRMDPQLRLALEDLLADILGPIELLEPGKAVEVLRAMKLSVGKLANEA